MGYAKRRQLAKQPLCEMCERRGRTVPATIVHHRTPHRGDWAMFIDRTTMVDVQSLPRLQRRKAQSGMDIRMTLAQWLAERSPASVQHRQSHQALALQRARRNQPSAIPVVLVCGPPAAGKTAYVQQHRQAGDTVIDLDECEVRYGGRPWDTEITILHKAMAYRATMIRGLAEKRKGTAYLIVGAPTADEHKEWKAALGAVTVVVIATPEAECIARIKADPARAHAREDLIVAVRKWWRAYKPARAQLSSQLR